MRTSARSRVGAAVLAVVLLGGAGIMGASAAQAKPGDQVSLEFQPGDFGPQKTGTTERRTFLVTNDGVDPVVVDPTPVTTITAPFAPISTTITSTAINPGDTRTITVDYTAGAIGTTPTQSVQFTATSANDMTKTGKFSLQLSGESIATDPASFEITDPASGMIDFGSVTAGTTVTRTVVVTNDGVRDLKFESGAVSVVGTDGGPIPVTVVGAPFVKEVLPGASASIDLLFSPTVAGSFSGVVTIEGRQYSGDVLLARAIRTAKIAAVAVALPDPTPSPTPGGSGGAGTTTGSGHSTGAAGTNGRTLASTGAESAGVFAGASVALMLLVGGGVALVQRRRRAKA